MVSLEELVADFRAHKLKLPALFEAIDARGGVTDEQHAREQEWLHQQEERGELDARVVRALLAKLKFLQPTLEAGTSSDNAEPDEDATRIQAPTPADDADGTIFQSPAAGDEDSATVVRPASQGQPTSNTTGTNNTSSWQRVAGAAGGGYATVGMLLKGRFLLERELGRGGMGVVYLARDERKVEARDRDPYVAVKVLNDEFRRRPDSLIALQREARRSQRLAHDNIVRVYDFDKDDTIVFMTMEYIDGTNLKTLIRERALDGMALDEARPLIAGMARALGRAHVASVVHSDFKPGNVMVTPQGAPKVFDFGIARAGKVGGDAKGEETVFDAGTLGALTPAYASLEMLRGAEPAPADDIYALGCVAYELLTGSHPFDKVSAEVALKEGRKPPHVHRLTRRQNRTLAAAVAFDAGERLKDVDALVEGLRDIRWSERARPFMIYGAVAVVVVALAGWGVHRYVIVQRVDQVVERFGPDSPQRYANEGDAYKALASLGSDRRKRVVVDHSNVIQAYLLHRLQVYWNLQTQHYDYAGVQHVFAIRDQLKLYSPKLDARRQAIEQQRNTLLNTLDTQLSQRMDAGAIFRDQPNNVVDTLDAIRAINPDSPLLHNPELELKYSVAIGKTLDAGKLDQARRQLAVARQLFPDAEHLRHRAAQLTALEQTQASTVHVQTTDMSAVEAREALRVLLAKPSLSNGWREALAATLHVLRDDDATPTGKLVAPVPGIIAKLAQHATTPSEVQRAAELVTLGLSYLPDAKPLLVQRVRLAGLYARHEARLKRESTKAEVASRIESLKRAAAAHDIDKARHSLERIRALQPNQPILDGKGPQLLADTYLGKAKSLADQGKYRLAADTVGAGLNVLGHRDDLQRVHTRLDFVADLIRARTTPPSATGIDQLARRLAQLQRADAKGLARLQTDIKRQGVLPEGTFSALVSSLKSRVVDQSALVPATPATATAVGSAAGRAKAAPHGVSSAHPPSAQTTSKSVAKAAPANVSTASTDPCARSGLVGSGRVCLDHVGARRGPSLVVVPGQGGRPYAMSRTEITVRQFNQFCSVTHQCKVAGGPAGLPVTDVSLADAKAYAAWLSKVTGHLYRLPTAAQWVHAAKAGQGWKQSPDSNCIPPSGRGGMGGPISARGRQPNPWGLVNMTGNVWEWVITGGQASIRGGGYDSYWSECSVSSHRSAGGQPQADVGFRVLREVQ